MEFQPKESNGYSPRLDQESESLPPLPRGLQRIVNKHNRKLEEHNRNNGKSNDDLQGLVLKDFMFGEFYVVTKMFPPVVVVLRGWRGKPYQSKLRGEIIPTRTMLSFGEEWIREILYRKYLSNKDIFYLDNYLPKEQEELLQ